MRLLLLLCCLIALPARAQTPASSVEAEARAEGDRLIAQAGAEGIFVNESEGGAILLRHTLSGFRCVFNPGKAANRVAVFPNARRGDDVGCATQTVTDTRTLYLTRTDPRMTEQTALDAAVAALRARYPNAQPIKADRDARTTLFGRTDLPQPKVAVLRVGDVDERVDVGRRGPWMIKYRYTAPAGMAAQGGPLDMFWPFVVLEAETPESAPPAAAPTPPPASTTP